MEIRAQVLNFIASHLTYTQSSFELVCKTFFLGYVGEKPTFASVTEALPPNNLGEQGPML
jgi:hypothetical protein